jgi:hypothetical protein
MLLYHAGVIEIGSALAWKSNRRKRGYYVHELGMIYDRYQPRVILLLRYPGAVAFSQLREARVPQPQMTIMLTQNELYEDQLPKYRSVMESAVTSTELRLLCGLQNTKS